MSDRIKRLQESVGESDWKLLIDAFLLECHICRLTAETINGCVERIAYLMKWFREKAYRSEELATDHIQVYLMSIIGCVSDASINDRDCLYRVLFNCLEPGGFLRGDILCEGY